MQSRANIREVDRRRKADALDVLCAAFDDYPVMRYVIGEADPNYDGKLRELIGFFVEARLTRNVPLIGVYEADELMGVAVVSPPEQVPVPPELAQCHARIKQRLGPEAMARFDQYDEACEATDPGHLAHYLGMIAVRPGAQGRGLGRQLIEAVKELARCHPASAGVTLNTESPGNLPFYQRMGFHRSAEADFGPHHTWSLYWSCE